MFYRYLRLARQRIFAYPSSGLPKCVWNMRYPYCGGRNLRRFFAALNRFGLDKILAPKRTLKVKEFDVNRVQKKIEEFFGQKPIGIAYTWPSVSRSTGRCYAYVYDVERSDLLGFLKIAYLKEDIAELTREVDALLWVKNCVRHPCSVPQIIFSEMLGPQVMIALFEPLPEKTDPIEWNQSVWKTKVLPIKERLSHGTDRVMAGDLIFNEQWVHNVQSMRPDLIRYVKAASNEGVRVCATHGDMAQHNFRVCGDDIWLFDWESFTLSGPMLVDELTVYMSVRRFAEKRSIEKVIGELINDYPINNKEIARDVISAAAFIVGNKMSYHQDFAKLIELYGKGIAKGDK